MYKIKAPINWVEKKRNYFPKNDSIYAKIDHLSASSDRVIPGSVEYTELRTVFPYGAQVEELYS